MPSAIVTGATGILGREIVHALGKDQQQWPTVHALSRGKKETYPSNVVHNHIDLTSSAEEMAEQLKDVEGEVLFFSAYLQKDTEQENWDVNALEISGSVKPLKKIILVTGAKQYGVHLGLPKNPMDESDPRLDGDSWPPNFYYRQQDILKKFCNTHTDISWIVTYPNDVIGFAEGNFMNLATSLALYASISKELGQDLTWPGSEYFYTSFDCFTSSKLHAQFVLWAALSPVKNEAFNVVNGDVESWAKLWPLLADRFGLKVAVDQFSQPALDKLETKLAPTPPISIYAKEAGLGVLKQSTLEQRINLANWSKREDVKEAWQRLAEREGLDKDALKKATWEFLGFVLGRDFPLIISMSKARKLGWTGYADTWDAFSEVFDELEAAKILPKKK